jgi:hypothetical protein
MEPELRTPEELRRSGLHWSGMQQALMMLGSVLSFAGMAMLWVGIFGG